ncbi:MAG: protein BatD [Pseudomonas sp.]|nr:protein BatD [Pseudomonas sp.]
MIRLLFALVLACAALSAQAAGLAASVDRTRLSLDETLELTLEARDAAVFGRPDLQPLNELFEVYDTRQLNSLSNVGGEAQAVTRWLTTLRPRRTGYLIIPSLQLGDWHSDPITVFVQEARGNHDSALLAPVFIDASVDRESVYVQAQIILTLRIYHSVSLYDDSTLSPLQMPDALVKRLGEPRTYEKDINGVRHGVIEVRYALFPQKSGRLQIPSQLFSATTVASGNDYSILGPRPGRSAQVKSPTIPVEVKPKPRDYPTDAPWLPATSLTLVEAWSGDPGKAQVGDSLTRSLLIKAEGLTSAQLPPLGSAPGDGLRRYPDQPGLADETGPNGVVGSREDREALVPTRAGEVELPALEVVWWNVEQDRLERTNLAARQLSIAENPQLEEAPLSGPAEPRRAAAKPLWPWQLSTALLGLTTLLGFGLWWRARRQPPVVQRSAASGPTPRSLLDDLRRACQANDTQATRQALDAWARQQPETLAEMAARFVPLSEALDSLNGALYSETGQRWQGEALWQAIRSLPPLETPTAEQDSGALPPLYPR